MTLKKRTSSFLVPFVLCTMGSLAFVFAGCSREETKVSPSPAPSAPAANRMEDESYLKTLSADRVRYVALVRDRNAIAEKMRAMVEAKKAELKTDDLDKVKAVLDKDAVWQALYKECEAANARVERQRQEAQKDVRKKMNESKGSLSGTSGKDSASPLKAPQKPVPVKKISK